MITYCSERHMTWIFRIFMTENEGHAVTMAADSLHVRNKREVLANAVYLRRQTHLKTQVFQFVTMFGITFQSNVRLSLCKKSRKAEHKSGCQNIDITTSKFAINFLVNMQRAVKCYIFIRINFKNTVFQETKFEKTCSSLNFACVASKEKFWL